jgi:hypothetical protein
MIRLDRQDLLSRFAALDDGADALAWAETASDQDLADAVKRLETARDNVARHGHLHATWLDTPDFVDVTNEYDNQ